jgi:hypothetical protein
MGLAYSAIVREPIHTDGPARAGRRPETARGDRRRPETAPYIRRVSSGTYLLGGGPIRVRFHSYVSVPDQYL